jgi:Signal transduction histidine kinase
MNATQILVLLVVTGCLIIAAGSIIYLNYTFHKISSILDGYLTGKFKPESDVKETRESKLIVQLRSILDQSENERDKAKQEKEEVSQLISDLSHQLKTPLSNLSMYLELLQNKELREEERNEFLNKMGEQQKKLEWLIKILIRISRLEVGIIDFEAKPEYIRETLADSVSMVFAASTNKQIEIVLEEFEDIKLIHSRKWTKEAIANILENGIKYSPSGSCIRVKVVPMELYTKIIISDEGIGIPQEEYTQIFQRFYRGKQVKEQEGTGLGLYLARLILSKEGGYITVASRVGEGTYFSVFLQNKS